MHLVKKNRSFLIHGYMLCSIVATIVLFFSPRIAMILYSVGASSGYIAMGIFTAATVSPFFGFCSAIWICLFPVLLVVSYILAIKKHYIPFCICIILDALIVLAWCFYSLAANNISETIQFIPDTIISVAFAIIMPMFLDNKNLNSCA